ncbi:MAG: DUF962 domain-containing protein [Nevskiales bacterium]
MRTQTQFLDKYQESHQNPLNSFIHIICVPAIFFASVGLLWAIPIGRWLGLGEGVAPWVNLATITALPILFFYLRLSPLATITAIGWFVLSVLGIFSIQRAGLPLVWTCLAIWVAAWAVQFYGHHVEGAKPSFADDMLFLLIGPLYVMNKLYRKLGMALH